MVELGMGASHFLRASRLDAGSDGDGCAML